MISTTIHKNIGVTKKRDRQFEWRLCSANEISVVSRTFEHNNFSILSIPPLTLPNNSLEVTLRFQ